MKSIPNRRIFNKVFLVAAIFLMLIIQTSTAQALSKTPGSDPTGKSQRNIIEKTPWLDPTACPWGTTDTPTVPPGGGLIGDTNAVKVWNFLRGRGLTPVAAAGVMGNLVKESNFRPNLVQYGTINSRGEISVAGEPSSLSDTMVINGISGYGIVQWTSINRQQNLRNYAVAQRTIDGDLNTQLNFLYIEAGGIWQNMNATTSVYENNTARVWDDGGSTMLFHRTYVRSADGPARLLERIDSAVEFLTLYGSGTIPGAPASPTPTPGAPTENACKTLDLSGPTAGTVKLVGLVPRDILDYRSYRGVGHTLIFNGLG